MSGVDKSVLMRKLVELGWKKVSSNEECESVAGYCLVPPDSLWKNKPSAFYVYEARDLQELLNTSTNDKGETLCV